MEQIFNMISFLFFSLINKIFRFKGFYINKFKNKDKNNNNIIKIIKMEFDLDNQKMNDFTEKTQELKIQSR